MILGKLVKDHKLLIYEQKETGNEIESFSLLKLSLQETCDLIKLIKNESYGLDGSISTIYKSNDDLHSKWKEIAVEHNKRNPNQFFDVSAKFKTLITGTSCLIRDPIKHTIKICLRKKDDVISINRICIDNSVRQRFFNDVKSTKSYSQSNKYELSTEDLDVYTYWSKYMNNSFIYQYKKLRESKYKGKGNI